MRYGQCSRLAGGEARLKSANVGQRHRGSARLSAICPYTRQQDTRGDESRFQRSVGIRAKERKASSWTGMSDALGLRQECPCQAVTAPCQPPWGQRPTATAALTPPADDLLDCGWKIPEKRAQFLRAAGGGIRCPNVRKDAQEVRTCTRAVR